MTDRQRATEQRDATAAAAERPTPAQTQAAERIGVVLESEDARRSRALADAQAEAVRLQMDETVVGGHYIVNGQAVDASGKAIAEKKD